MPERVFPLPDLGEGLEEAVVSAWLVAEGDTVELNQPFVEIETAKATVEVPAPFAGTISKLHVGAGKTLAVGAPLATFEVTGSVGATAVATTPAVRKLAKDLGVDLSDVAGSGPDGRITRADVERLADSGREPEDVGRSTTVPLSPTRRAIAARLTEVAAIPQVTTFRTIDCSALETHRESLRVSPLPVFVKALAEVCRGHPELNSSWDGERILLFPEIRVGIATDTERGLMVPVLADVGSLGISEIGRDRAPRRGGAVEHAVARRRRRGDDRRHEHRQLRLGVRDAAPQPRARGDDRTRGDRAPSPRRRRRRASTSGVHALVDVRPSRARRGDRRPGLGRARRAPRVAGAPRGPAALTGSVSSGS